MIIILSVCFLSFYINNLFVLFLLIELQTFCILIILGSVNNFQVKIIESALKYLILSGIVSVFFLFGIFLLYYNSNNLFLKNSLLYNNIYSYISLMIIFTSLSFKFGFVPFHFWLLDIYESCNWSILSIVVTIPKLTYFFIIFRLNLFDNIILFFGLLCLLIGSLGALNQIKIKRLLGYSSITHSGFIILCLILPKSIGFSLGLLYFFIYLISFLVLLYFFFIIRLENRLYHLSKFIYYKNFMGILVLISIFSLSGFPPFSGFISKWYVIYYFVKFDNLFIAFILVFFSIISMAYYLNLIKILFFESDKKFYIWNNLYKKDNYSNNLLNLIPYYFLFLSVTLFLNPDILFSFIYCF